MMPDEILVVFTDQTDLWWLKFLRRGFRHCFIILRFADVWISLDPLAHKTEIMRIDLPDGFDLRRWLESQGDLVLRFSGKSPELKPLWPCFFTCVEAVKRTLGVRNPFILTPWQLYRFLKTDHERIL